MLKDCERRAFWNFASMVLDIRFESQPVLHCASPAPTVILFLFQALHKSVLLEIAGEMYQMTLSDSRTWNVELCFSEH